jgi:transposase
LITVGVDAHKRLNVAVALDEQGHELANWRGRNSAQAWVIFRSWLEELGPVRRIGIEGAWSLGRGLAQHLVEQGETVFEVNSRWTADGRRRARKTDKNDRLDARAVATFLMLEGDKLQPIMAEDESTVLGLLANEREAAVGEATRVRNQLHALLHKLDPEYEAKLPRLTSQAGVTALLEYPQSGDSAVARERAASVRRLAGRLSLIMAQVKEVSARIRALAAARFEPLTRMCGVDLLMAGLVAGELGPGMRFVNDAQLASFAGVAPIEASSAGRTRHRLSRGGNRRLNAYLYRIALTQAHYSPEARSYLARRVSEGKTRREALRALKRYIARALFRLWRECQEKPVPPVCEQAAACT